MKQLTIRRQKFRRLEIWQKAMSLVTQVYQATERFPQHELYGLTNQIRRAAVSITLNIAEGSGADSDQEFRRFLVLARRSTYEVMCGLEVAVQLKYLPDGDAELLLNSLEELSAMLHGFIKKLKAEG
jgi:four helix bundle protein